VALLPMPKVRGPAPRICGEHDGILQLSITKTTKRKEEVALLPMPKGREPRAANLGCANLGLSK